MNYKDRKDYYIYLHISPTNKYYVGYSCQINPNSRYRNGNGYKKCPLFYKAINKYGWSNFKHIILEKGLTFEQANDREKYYINLYNSNNSKFGYNLTPGGSNPNQSEESKEKNRLKHLGKRYYPSIIYQYNNKCELLNIFGSYRDAAEKTNIKSTTISSAVLNDRITNEMCFSKKKLSNNEILKRFEEFYNRGKIFCYDVKKSIYIGKYDSLTEASNCLNIRKDIISRSCSDNTKNRYGDFPRGYLFRHYELSNEELNNYCNEYKRRQELKILNRSNQYIYEKCGNKNIKSLYH